MDGMERLGGDSSMGGHFRENARPQLTANDFTSVGQFRATLLSSGAVAIGDRGDNMLIQGPLRLLPNADDVDVWIHGPSGPIC